jgi:hypothetical protein
MIDIIEKARALWASVKATAARVKQWARDIKGGGGGGPPEPP